MSKIIIKGVIAALVLQLAALWPDAAFAADAVNGANTAWILTSTALVLFMTLPGLALFYAGLVQSKNVLSVMMHCFAICCVASVLWLVGVYSLAFGDGGGLNAVVGGLGKAFLSGVGWDGVSGDIPETVFFMFQMTFAIITPALIVGAYPERVKFAAVLLLWRIGSGAAAGWPRWESWTLPADWSCTRRPALRRWCSPGRSARAKAFPVSSIRRTARA